jgi:hypothetical protein
MNIKNTDSISFLIANSGNQKKYHPVSELKADILADVEADKTLQDTIIQSILSTHQDTIIQSILSNVAAPVLATESTITEEDVDPAIAIDVTKNTFIDTDSESADNWIIDFGETNLILDSIAKVSATEINIKTTGTAEVGTIRILALKDCFDSPIVDSTVLEIEVQEPEE